MKLTGRLFFRSQTPSGSASPSPARRAGMLVGVLRLPRRMPLEGFVVTEGSPAAGLACREMLLPFDADSMPWMSTVPETPVGHLLNGHHWRAFDDPRLFTLYLRQSVLPVTEDHVWAVTAGALMLPQEGAAPAWRDEHLYTFADGQMVDQQDMTEAMHGMSVESVFRQPWWGPDANLSLPSSMHRDILHLMQEHEDLCCVPEAELSIREAARLAKLAKQLRGIIQNGDPEFSRFREAMRARLRPMSYLRGQTKEELAHRDAVGEAVIRELMDAPASPRGARP